MVALERHTIFLTVAGSHGHGTPRAGSDVDLRGICIAPLPVRLSLFTTFDQYEGLLPDALGPIVLPGIQAHPTAAQGIAIKSECAIFDIAKFVSLCTSANPSALEILFADERDWVLESAPWRRLHRERHRFLTKKVQQTFLGYAMAQLKRIRTHRSWLLHPPARKPRREDFGLPVATGTLSSDDQTRLERSIADRLRTYGIDNIEMSKAARVAVQEHIRAFCRELLAVDDDELAARMRAVASHSLGIPTDVVAALNAERKYQAAMKHWDSHQTWLAHRNPSRAELERAHGYDTKHAMHLIRLMRMGLEVLEVGELRVRRDDAAELMDIRDGALTFDELLAEATRLEAAMAEAAAVATLPDAVDTESVDALAIALMSEVRT